jgi:tetratricopeptide (TPR) repeat protein
MKRQFIFAIAAIFLPICAGAIDVRTKGELMASQDISADALLKQADSLFKEKKYPEALAAYQTTLDTAGEEFNYSIETEALSQVARCLLIAGKKVEGREYLTKAEQKAVITDPMGWSRYLSVKGRFEWKSDSLPAARETFSDMFNFCSENGLWGRMIDAANMMAIIADNVEAQIDWGRKGIEAAEAGGEEHWLGPLWNNLGATYYDNKQNDSALECYVKAREYHWRFSDETAKLFADYHVGMVNRMLGNFTEAKSWLRPVLAWAERLENHSAIAQTLEDLGEIDIAEGNDQQGLESLKRAREEFKAAGYEANVPDIWKSINARIAELGG